MSTIGPEACMRFFEKTSSVRFVDTRTGPPALEVLQEEKQKSDYDHWLAAQDEATQREHNMGAI
ncbi:hypothetical protein [Ottowia sp.]|uniref:hypothetical protein n=1 Tax=Ottowia sp. TaxID=1898956 RepID=UPI003A8A316B